MGRGVFPRLVFLRMQKGRSVIIYEDKWDSLLIVSFLDVNFTSLLFFLTHEKS